ncbi:MAG: CPBP family intramembrane metalloprotease [Ignavibacteriae bacterium]|nr:CPBP family intramembrane metalloprotease [Ignavibacteriota bacterium]
MNYLEIYRFGKNEFLRSLFITVFLFLFYTFFIWEKTELEDFLISVPYFLICYFIFFSIGSDKISKNLSNLINYNLRKAIFFPLLLVTIYYSYIFVNGENPLQGTTFLFPFFILFPTLIFLSKNENIYKIDWIDFFTFTLFLLPTTLIKFEPNTNLPFSGGGFDSLFRITIMIIIVYSFSIIRKLNDVGFYPIFSLKFLKIAIVSWISFYVAALIIGLNFEFIKFVGYKEVSVNQTLIGTREVLAVFLHTAIFEELFFRGLLQNLLSKRIYQSQKWLTFWKWGFIILAVLSALTGFLMKGKYGWIILAVTIILFSTSFYFENKKFDKIGSYTSLAITSIIFGIVHFHAGSIVFVALASLAGWAYGYTYLKTKNVFYAALVHALVNNTDLFLGLELIK